MTETTELADGINAVSERIQTLINNVDRRCFGYICARPHGCERAQRLPILQSRLGTGSGFSSSGKGRLSIGTTTRLPWRPDTDQSVLMHARAVPHENCISHWFNILMARPAGLEPATLGLEGRCSIRLSYGRLEFLCVNLSQSVSTATFSPSNRTTAPFGRYTPFRLTF